jgi:hypothetical protein
MKEEAHKPWMKAKQDSMKQKQGPILQSKKQERIGRDNRAGDF